MLLIAALLVIWNYLGILDGSDEALRTSTFPTFINVVHEPWPFRLGTSEAHWPVAFLAVGFFGKGSRSS
jgi:hypothetical protein